ncbi:MAG: YfhO family protein [Prolixibacteraceae bacterium]|nr:YfhO family protein [Prolixibacteraceae bacterium]
MKKNLPLIVTLVTAILVSYLYFSPVISGKRLQEHDRLTAAGAQKEYNDHLKKTGESIRWSNSMFGGMPTITFAAKFKGNVITSLRKIEKLGAYPATFLIILILGAYLCLILFGISPWLSLFGALLFSFASYFFILAGAGHITKLWALAYLPPLIGAIHYTFNKNKLIGALLTTLFLALEISSVHPQITYYGLIAVLLYGIFKLVYAIVEKTVKPFFISTLYLIIPLFIAVGVNANYLLSTQEYSKYSTRGGTELTKTETESDKGLSKDYILDYSYDVTEAITAFIPRLKGGGMSEPLGENSQLFEVLSKSQGKQQAARIVENSPLYWGSQPIVSGPFYFGAITIFLFVLGLFLVKGFEKWWLVSVVVVSFLLSLGRYFPALSHFAIDYIPLYDKFRDVKNIVFIQHFAMWVLGLLALKELFQDRKLEQKKQLKGLQYATIVAGGIALLFAIIPSLAGDFKGSVDAQLSASGWPNQLLEALEVDRIAVARADAFRSLVFVLLSAGLIWLTLKNKLKAKYALIAAAVLVLADMWPVNKRYLNNDNFVPKRKAETPYEPSKANLEILKDTDPNYRVFNIALNPFSDASTSYFHKSVGGYSGAKLSRYQDLIEHQLSKEMQLIGSRLRNVQSMADVEAVFTGLNALNMLNTRYIIYNPDAAPLMNPQAFGNAWFVENYRLAENANHEVELIGATDLKNVAVIDKRFEQYLSSSLKADSTASIQLLSYTPEKLVYRSSAQSDQLAVFSEIYYPKGWTARVDGVATEIFRANYVLRAMMVPAGEHEIVFEFKPKSYEIGNKISLASSILLMLAAAGVLYVEFRKRRKHA